MKQILKLRCEAPRNLGVLRRCESPIATPGTSADSTPHAPREGIYHTERDAYVVPPGRSGPRESRCAGRSISPKWKRIFLTSLPNMLPEKRVWDSPVGRNLDKIGQNWPKLAKIGHGWPNLDKAGQFWTAVGQLFPAVLGCLEQHEECQAKTHALFLAGLRGPGSDRPLRSGNETTKKRRQKTALSKIGQMPIDAAEQKQGAGSGEVELCDELATRRCTPGKCMNGTQ